MRFLLIISSIILSLAITSCGDKEQSTENKKEITGKEDAPTSVDAVIPLGPIGLVSESLHKEPKKDPWKGEVFNDLADSQLKELGKIIKNPKSIALADTSNLIANNFQPVQLVPKNLKTIFNGPSFKILRDTSPEQPSEKRNTFNDALNELLEPISESTKIDVKFKTFNVSINENGKSMSESYVEISGHTQKEIITQKARWKCSWEWESSSEPPKIISIRVNEFEQSIGTRSSDGTLFTDCTGSVFSQCIDFKNQFLRGTDYWASRLENRYGIGLSGWHGIATGDVNGDGIDDIYVCEPGGLPNRLFISKSDGQLIDASSLSGTNFRLQTQSALFLDMDNDGDQDLVIATTLGIIFMANDGRANFTVRSTKLIPESAPMCISAADYDLDGDLDLHVGCYSLRRSSVHGNGNQMLARPIPYHDANNGGRNVLLRNDLNWQFNNVTISTGMDVNNRRFTLASSWEDYDQDGDPDLYVANDYGRNNLYRNERDSSGNSRFIDVAAEAGVEDMSAGMSVSWSDADGDGDQDLYVSNMWSSAGNRIAYQRQFQQGADQESITGFRRHARGNSLFLNSGNGKFKDASVEAGVTMGRWAWGARFADINNDGMQDIIVANGFITQSGDTGDL
ncbi:MAG: FG-GAP-like repeat-containing protein [Verrucomicrobiales bacterium]|nr:FG-GAP-like repeat-containing protein [Verrucomicrobiales bacterium]